MTTNDTDWVEDVRRWYFNGGRSESALHVNAKAVSHTPGTEFAELGYEAANPNLQSASWSTPAASGFGDLR